MRPLKGDSPPRHIWEGIYPTLAAVPQEGRGFAGSTWITRSRAKLEELLADGKKSKPDHPAYAESLLPMLVGSLLADGQAKTVDVLDYGGGPGFGYVAVRNAIPNVDRLRFTIKEVPEVCVLGREYFPDEASVRFRDQLEEGPFDIVHLGSSIQYEEDWRGLLAKLSKRCRGWLLVTDLPAGSNPTYATAQRYYESTLPSWCFNEQDFVENARTVGLNLAFRSTYSGLILGKVGMAQDNFPASHRVQCAVHLLFRAR